MRTVVVLVSAELVEDWFKIGTDGFDVVQGLPQDAVLRGSGIEWGGDAWRLALRFETETEGLPDERICMRLKKRGDHT